MNIQVSLHEVTETCGSTYESLDIRTAALKFGNGWGNVLTIVRLGYESVKEVSKKHRDLESLHILPELEEFKILLSSKRFSEWPEFCSSLKSPGCVPHNNEAVHLTGALDVLEKTGYLNRHHKMLRQIPGRDWPTCEISLQHRPTDAESLGFTNRSLLLSDRKLTQRINQFGHSSAFDAIDAFMELANSFAQSPDLEFLVSLPVFAAIDNVQVTPTNNLISVQARFHARLPGVRFFAVCSDSPMGTGLRPKATLALQVSGENDGTDSIRNVFAHVQLPSQVTTNDIVEIKAVGAMGDIDSYSRRVYDLQPSEHTHPLYRALTTFCPTAELSGALAYPQAMQIPKRQPWGVQDYFERNTCWLLSCFGFASVMLGEYETLRTTGSKFQRGSLDVLAFNEARRILLLVACTLNAPKEDDFGNLMALRSIFLDEIFANSSISTIPVMFTGVRSFQTYWTPNSDEFGIGNFRIPVVDGSRAQTALDLIPKSRDLDFLYFLLDPTHMF